MSELTVLQTALLLGPDAHRDRHDKPRQRANHPPSRTADRDLMRIVTATTSPTTKPTIPQAAPPIGT